MMFARSFLLSLALCALFQVHHVSSLPFGSRKVEVEADDNGNDEEAPITGTSSTTRTSKEKVPASVRGAASTVSKKEFATGPVVETYFASTSDAQ